MVETPESNREERSAPFLGAGMGSPEVKAWFLHDVYIRVYEAACRQIPEQTKPFVFTTARNLLISRVRKRQVIPIEAVADLDALGIAMDSPGPDRSAIARDELRR